MSLPSADEVYVRAIAQRWEALRERIARSCQRAGRLSREVTLVGVTKTFPLGVIAAALEAGLRDLGENRVQELALKARATPQDACRWHMIGHLQRNKAKDVVKHADVFHAIDSLRLAETLNKRAEEAARALPCFVQVNVSQEGSKFGLEEAETLDVLRRLEELEHLRIIGLMTLAAPARDPEEVRPQFRKMRALLEAYEGKGLSSLSMGMSGDFEIAIEEGATHIRVGSALFGRRQ